MIIINYLVIIYSSNELKLLETSITLRILFNITILFIVFFSKPAKHTSLESERVFSSTKNTVLY